jgi:hypothetical protein
MSLPLPQPHEVRAAITERLMANTDLLDLLADNHPWNAPGQTAIPQHSIVPMDEISKMKPRYVGIMAGPMPRRERVSFDAFFYIRVYDRMDRDYIKIEKAVYQIAKSLNGARLSMANTVMADSVLETVQPERVDEALNQKYRELQFRLVIL